MTADLAFLLIVALLGWLFAHRARNHDRRDHARNTCRLFKGDL